METLRPIPEEIAKQGIAGAVTLETGAETFRDFLFQRSRELESNGVDQHPVRTELLKRAWMNVGARLDTVVTREMIDTAGAQMLAELREQGLVE